MNQQSKFYPNQLGVYILLKIESPLPTPEGWYNRHD